MLWAVEGMQDLLAHLKVQMVDLQTGLGVVPRVPDPDVVVVADEMPLMPARELVALTRERCDLQAGAPLIVITTTAAADRRTALLDAGADDCLSVPFAGAELRARVARLVRGRKRTEELLALNSPEPGDDAQRLCRREGDYWTIAFGGVTLRLRDCKGLHHLSWLLAHPHGEVHALMLTAPPADGDEDHDRAAAIASGTDRWHIGLGDAGAMLDAQAKAAYRRRLEQLKEMRDEARRFADRARVEHIEAEMDALARELAAAVGLGGRDRRAAASAERARINVTRTIKAAIDAIAAHHPPLARHLRASVRTGTFSCYAPPPGAGGAWLVG